MASVLVALMSMVLIVLCVDMLWCNLLDCLRHEGMRAAVSSANVRKWVLGILVWRMRNSESEAIAKIRSESRHPCRIPLDASELPYVVPLSVL